MGRPKSDPMKRFLAKVEKSSDLAGCWLWIDKLDPCGYGRGMSLRVGVKHHQLAHRIAWILFKGPIPSKTELDHLCRVKRCVNPDHLEPVTRKVNAERAAPFNPNKLKTECKRGHPLDDAYRHNGRRHCRTCAKERHDVYNPIYYALNNDWRGPRNSEKTHCPHGHPLDGEYARPSGKTGRYCKTCARARRLAYYEANRAKCLESMRAYKANLV